jgi:hypothetical protein
MGLIRNLFRRWKMTDQMKTPEEMIYDALCIMTLDSRISETLKLYHPKEFCDAHGAAYCHRMMKDHDLSERMAEALRGIILNKEIRSFLEKEDPKALEAADAALAAYNSRNEEFLSHEEAFRDHIGDEILLGWPGDTPYSWETMTTDQIADLLARRSMAPHSGLKILPDLRAAWEKGTHTLRKMMMKKILGDCYEIEPAE